MSAPKWDRLILALNGALAYLIKKRNDNGVAPASFGPKLLQYQYCN